MKQISLLTILLFLTMSCFRSKENISNEKQTIIEYEQLDNKSLQEVRITRNEIFARYRYKFTSQDFLDL